jgi:predicted short-subunit dehydrogenase-like oxidoreductase (DUF2520 family)
MGRTKAPELWNAAIIGGGKVGTSLGRVLVEQGHRVACVVSRTAKSARASAEFIGCENAGTALAAIPGTVNLILIAAPHGAVADVARALARLDRSLKGVSVCHASGMLTASVLEPLKEKGATVFSFHPIQAFPRTFPFEEILPNVRGIYYGVDGTAAGVRAAYALARALKGYVVEVPPEMREFYHAAAVVASNHLTTLFGVLHQMASTFAPEGGDWLSMYFPIIMASIGNVRVATPEKALTGPVARGGVETVARHLDALEKYGPGLVPFYAAVSLETAQLAARSGSLATAQKDELLRLLEPCLSPEARKKNRT